MAGKHNRRDRDYSVPKPKKEIKIEESGLMKAVKTPAFIKFLEKQPQYSDFIDRLPNDRDLQREVQKIFKAWEKAPEVISELNKFYAETISQETGIKLNEDDLKAIKLYINQLTIDPDTCQQVEQLFDKIKKFKQFPEDISKKQIELVSLADNVSIETAREKERLETAVKSTYKEIEKLNKQLETREQRLEKRLANQGWLNKKNIPLLGRLFRDREDNLARAKSVKEWQTDIKIIKERIHQLETMQIDSSQASQHETVLQGEEKIRTGQETIQNFRGEYQGLKQYFLRDFELIQDVVGLARVKMQKEYDSIIKDNDNFALDNAQRDFDRLIDKKSGELSDQLFADLKQDYLTTLDEAISARFYEDCQRVMRTFAWGKDSDKGKLKGLLQKFLAKQKLGSQFKDTVSGIAAAALIDTMLASRDDRKKFTLKSLAADLGLNLEESLAAAISQAQDENERNQLTALAAKMIRNMETRAESGVSSGNITDRLEAIKANAEQFLVGLDNVHSYDELIGYVKSQPKKVFHFEKAVYFEKYLLDIIEEAKKTKNLDKFNNAPAALQTKMRELLNPKAEKKTEKKPESPAPKAPEKPVKIIVPEPKSEEPEIKQEAEQEEVKPEDWEKKILKEESVSVLLENKIKAIKEAVNEMGAKLAIAEAGKLVERYLDSLKANRIISKSEYKKLKKEIAAELGQLKGNHLQAADKIEEINKRLKKIETESQKLEVPAEEKAAPEEEIEGTETQEKLEEYFDHFKAFMQAFYDWAEAADNNEKGSRSKSIEQARSSMSYAYMAFQKIKDSPYAKDTIIITTNSGKEYQVNLPTFDEIFLANSRRLKKLLEQEKPKENKEEEQPETEMKADSQSTSERDIREEEMMGWFFEDFQNSLKASYDLIERTSTMKGGSRYQNLMEAVASLESAHSWFEKIKNSHFVSEPVQIITSSGKIYDIDMQKFEDIYNDLNNKLKIILEQENPQENKEEEQPVGINDGEAVSLYPYNNETEYQDKIFKGVENAKSIDELLAFIRSLPSIITYADLGAGDVLAKEFTGSEYADRISKAMELRGGIASASETKDLDNAFGIKSKVIELLNKQKPEAENIKPAAEVITEDEAQEIIDGISSSQAIDEMIDYLQTVPRLVDADNQVMSGQEFAAKISRAILNAGEIDNMTEAELPTTYGLRDKLKELLGV